MFEVFACLIAFTTAFFSSWVSLGRGLIVTFTVGYIHGVFRANNLGAASTFLFDSAVLGLYFGYFSRPVTPKEISDSKPLIQWLLYLVGWAVIMCLLPRQSYAVQLVGLRAAIWFFPFILIGFRLTPRDLTTLGRGLAILNLFALAVACYLYVFGIRVLFPENVNTIAMYRSNDIAGGASRIPATFANSHAYGTTMVFSMPFLLGRIWVSRVSLLERIIIVGGLLAAGLGVFLCGARYPVVLLFGSVVLLLFLSGFRVGMLVVVSLMIAFVTYFVANDERMQRFLTLSDQNMVSERLYLSVNASFWDLVKEYPLGAGLGRAWGTSIPSFLQAYALPQIGLENEYSRFLVEQGLIGLILFVAFLVWAHIRPPLFLARGWGTLVSFAYACSMGLWLSAFIGAGALTSIPASGLTLLLLGIVVRFRTISYLPRVPLREVGDHANRELGSD